MRLISPSGNPVKRRYYSPETGREVGAQNMVRGYEWEKGHYIVVSDEELERLAPEKSRDINLRLFVPPDAIPPIYFERAYFLMPAGGTTKAYRLLAETMQETDRAGVATFVMRGKEYLIAIFSENGILKAETLRFHDEIRTPENVGLPKKAEPAKQAVTKFEKLLLRLSAKQLSRADMRDRTAEETLRLIERKRKKQEDVVHSRVEETAQEKAADLLSILKKSLGETKRRYG
jgi:DNA end-binding protein Ku